jgi:hypothetical protein
VVLNSTDLVEENCLAKFFDQLSGRSGIFPFIEKFGTRPFVQQLSGPFLDAFQ